MNMDENRDENRNEDENENELEDEYGDEYGAAVWKLSIQATKGAMVHKDSGSGLEESADK